jgi:hypothetical protein
VDAMPLVREAIRLGRIKSAPGIYVAGECHKGRFYEAAVHGSAIPWLRHNSKLDLEYDPTKPVDNDVRIHDVWEATRRVEARFLKNAAKALNALQERSHVAACLPYHAA